MIEHSPFLEPDRALTPQEQELADSLSAAEVQAIDAALLSNSAAKWQVVVGMTLMAGQTIRELHAATLRARGCHFIQRCCWIQVEQPRLVTH